MGANAHGRPHLPLSLPRPWRGYPLERASVRRNLTRLHPHRSPPDLPVGASRPNPPRSLHQRGISPTLRSAGSVPKRLPLLPRHHPPHPPRPRLPARVPVRPWERYPTLRALTCAPPHPPLSAPPQRPRHPHATRDVARSPPPRPALRTGANGQPHRPQAPHHLHQLPRRQRHRAPLAPGGRAPYRPLQRRLRRQPTATANTGGRGRLLCLPARAVQTMAIRPASHVIARHSLFGGIHWA